MHLTGKIFAFLTLCLAIAAIILTAKTLDRQNEWNSRIERARKGYQEAVAKIPAVKQEALQLRNELTRERLDWGRHWDNVQVAPRNLQLGQITIGIGRNDRISRQGDSGEQFPLLQAFQTTADGGVKYIGEFRVTQIDTTQAALQLSRAPRPGETATWDTNRPWRFRDAIPASKRTQIDELLLELTLIEQRIRDRQLNLATQQKSVQAAEASLEQRMKELTGNDELPAEAGEEYRVGFVEALKQAEAKRDAVLVEVQELREELHALYQKFETLLTENRELEQQLSQPVQELPSVSDSSDSATSKQ